MRCKVCGKLSSTPHNVYGFGVDYFLCNDCYENFPKRRYIKVITSNGIFQGWYYNKIFKSTHTVEAENTRIFEANMGFIFDVITESGMNTNLIKEFKTVGDNDPDGNDWYDEMEISIRERLFDCTVIIDVSPRASKFFVEVHVPITEELLGNQLIYYLESYCIL